MSKAITTGKPFQLRETTSAQEVSSAHIAWLDWIRFLAAFVVFLTHLRTALFVDYGQLEASQKNVLTAALWFISRLGNEAVIVFFVLSGYFVAGKGIARLMDKSFDLGGYSRDRISRIYTPFIPALIVTAVCALLTHQQISLSGFFLNLFGFQGILTNTFGENAPLWSLAYEIWFYLLLGSLFGAFFNRSTSQTKRVISALIFVACLIVFTILSPTYLFCWIIGGFSYFLPKDKFHWFKLVLSLVLLALCTIGTQLLTASSSVSTSAITKYLPPVDTFQIFLACAVVVVMLCLPSIPETKSGKAIEKAGTKLAAWSYTLYLVHYPILMVFKHSMPAKMTSINPGSLGFTLYATGVTMSICYGLYWIFERNTPAVREFLGGLRR